MTNQEASKRFGQRVAELRREKGITQTGLAEATGLTQAHISRIEDGRYDVRLSVMTVIADALGCSVELLKK